MIGPLPSSLDPCGEGEELSACSSQAIAITPVLPVEDTSTLTLDVDSDQDMLIYSIVTEEDTASPSASEVHTEEATAGGSPTTDKPSPADE